ncbi:Alanyl-tRNA editing protein AlaX-L [Tolypocladium ophioglossoides CBS 100239]|uniref:Alanyl-tRNA editing protein AlaX-L n=1 Tax=Tolypocladium ophioglossoides (strain CBS 100239) TaxID=1163406 RepID=A0A0L0MZH5_TOLOC|nr:Alanyl-tRNA editing protein AlaX-L [Tolypocladium ophioglossoides CBS 100239]
MRSSGHHHRRLLPPASPFLALCLTSVTRIQPSVLARLSTSRTARNTATEFSCKMAKRKAIYQHDETLRTHSTRVSSVRPFSALPEADRALFKGAADVDMVLVTDETIFYAQGGGQPFDTGVMASAAAKLQVSAVRNSVATPGAILHLGRCTEGTLREGDAVEQLIDAERRDDNSRLHTGRHLVALAVRKHLLAGAVDDASHKDLVELGASHYPDSAYVNFQGTIEAAHKDAIQEHVDAFINAGLPVKVYFWTEEELRARCAAVPGAVVIRGEDGGLVRAVGIEGAGAYPCGGTHVRDTSLVGKVTVKKISRSKGCSRVSYTVQHP